VDDAVAHFREPGALGISHVIIGIPELWRDAALDRLPASVEAMAAL